MSEKTEAPAAAAPAADAADATPKKKKGKGKLFLVLGVVFLLLGGGGAAAYFTLLQPDPAEGDAAAGEAHKALEANGMVVFEPFVVNLADPGGRRFLRINVRLLVPEEEEAKEIEESKVKVERLRAAILELLTAQTSEQIASVEGKTALKHAIIEHAKPILEPIEVSDVLFSDFVVQY